MRTRLLLSVIGASALLSFLPPALPVHAATFTVNDTSDLVDADPTDGQCRTVTNTCTLRAAVQQANASAGADTITVPAGTFLLTRANIPGALNEDDSVTGDLDLRGEVTITGAGRAQTIVDAAQLDRAFDILGATATISALTIRNGAGGHADIGSGINNEGILTLTDVLLTGNRARGQGGALQNAPVAQATLTNVAVSGNTAPQGGGIGNVGRMTIRNSSITANTATLAGNPTIQSSGGGGIFNFDIGTLELTDVTVTGNRAERVVGGDLLEGPGAGIASEGTMTLTRVTISGNEGTEEGGGISNGGVLILTNSAVVNNRAQFGGALANRKLEAMPEFTPLPNSGTATLTNVTLSGNTAVELGGALLNAAGANLGLINVTVADNAAPIGANIRNRESTLRLRNTIVANGRGGANCSLMDATITSEGNNIDSGASCGLSGSGDRANVDPRLGPLADNGGPTQTQTPQAGSPAIDAGTNTGCPATDQRGVTRPQDGNGDGQAVCDIGAVELAAQVQPRGDLAVTAADAPDPVRVAEPLTYTATVVNNGPLPALAVRVIQKLPPSVRFVVAVNSINRNCVFESAEARGKPLGRVVCQVGDVAVGASATATIQVAPTQAGSLGSVIRVKQAPTKEVDPNPANDQVSLTTTVVP